MVVFGRNSYTSSRLGQLPSAGGFGSKPQASDNLGTTTPGPPIAFEYPNGMCFFMNDIFGGYEGAREVIQDWVNRDPRVVEDDYLSSWNNFSLNLQRGGVTKIGVVFWQLGGRGWCDPDLVYFGANPGGQRIANFTKEFHEYRGFPWGQAAMDEMVTNQAGLLQQFCDEMKQVIEADFWGQLDLEVTPLADNRFVIGQDDMMALPWECYGGTNKANIYWGPGFTDYAQQVYQNNAAEISQYDLIINICMGDMGPGGGNPTSTGVGNPMVNVIVSPVEGLGTLAWPPGQAPGETVTMGPGVMGPCVECPTQGIQCSNWYNLPEYLACWAGDSYMQGGAMWFEWTDPNFEGYNPTAGQNPSCNPDPFNGCGYGNQGCMVYDPQGDCHERYGYCPDGFARSCARCTQGYFLDAGIYNNLPRWHTTGEPQDCMWNKLLPTADLASVMERTAGSLYAIASHELGHGIPWPVYKNWRHEVGFGGQYGVEYPPLRNDANISVWDGWMSMLQTYPCEFNGVYLDGNNNWAINPDQAQGPRGFACDTDIATNNWGLNTVNNMGYSQAWSLVRYPKFTDMWNGEDVGCNFGPEVAYAFVDGWMPTEYLHEITPPETGGPWYGEWEGWISAWDVLHVDKAANNDLDNLSSGHKQLAVRYPMSIDRMDGTDAPQQHMYITFFGRGRCDSRAGGTTTNTFIGLDATNDGAIMVQWGPWSANNGSYDTQNTCPTFIRQDLKSLFGIPDNCWGQDPAFPNFGPGNTCNRFKIHAFPTPNNMGDPIEFPGWRVSVIDEVRDKGTAGGAIDPAGVRTAVKLRITSFSDQT